MRIGILVVTAALPIAGMAAVLVLLFHALTDSWPEGIAVAIGAAVVFLAAVASFVRWANRHPEHEAAWMNLLGATAFGAGARGAERPRRDDTRRCAD